MSNSRVAPRFQSGKIDKKGSSLKSIEIAPLQNPPVFRKIALGTWTNANAASVYAQLDIDMTNALKYMAEQSEKHGIKITPTHLVGRAVARCMKMRPEINGFLRGGKIYLRKNVDLFFTVNVPGEKHEKVSKASLSGATVVNAGDLKVNEIAANLKAKAEKIKSKDDKVFKNTFRTFKFMPTWFVKHFLNLMSWLIYGLNLNVSALGFPRDPFGSVIISSIGGFGIDVAFAPLMPYSRVPILFTVGFVQKKAVVVGDSVEVRPVMSVGVTFDHRFIDGAHGGHMAAEFKRFFENPEAFD